jgi:D-alanyl-D-alanine endopeptidase (penicillin-binding protein 7)
VLLNSWGKNTRIGDANRIKKWMESANVRAAAKRS